MLYGTVATDTGQLLITLERVIFMSQSKIKLNASLAMMRNKSVAAATGDYIIEIDGDIFLHNKFVEDHKRLAKPGHYLRGTRVNLGQKLTEEICKSRVNRRIYPWTIGIQNRAETAIHSTPVSNFFADRYKKNVSSGLGCNMSFWRSDFLAINGYDEFFEGWGKEDDDLTHRLQRKGCKKRSLRLPCHRAQSMGLLATP